MQRVNDCLPGRVTCRIGSSETDGPVRLPGRVVTCRIGSSEI